MIDIAGWEDKLEDHDLVLNIITKIMAGRPDSTKYRTYSRRTPEGKERHLEAVRKWWRNLKADPIRFAIYREKQIKAKSRSGQSS